VDSRISLAAALDVLRKTRKDDEVVVTSMGAAREWTRLGTHPLDFVFVPSSMGQGTSLGLGIALAQPSRRVVVCNGDGSMLMNLGSLVTITAQAPRNLVVIVFDNGVYEVTGGQPTPGSGSIRASRGDVDFSALARGCGFESVFAFADLEAWKRDVRSVLDARGPVFVVMRVAADRDAGTPRSPGPGKDRVEAFRAALQGNSRR
jgi:thiamine pyrophosphate-dependent acetolactate synthase large subunit-like protein